MLTVTYRSAFACLALLLSTASAIVGIVSAGQSSHAATTVASTTTVTSNSTLPTFALSSDQQAMATSVALRIAQSSAPPSSAQPTAPGAWPDYVNNVTAIGTDHASAAMYVDQSLPADDAPVIVVRMVGSFTTEVPVPQGGVSPYNGTVETLTIDASTGVIRDFGINDVANLPAPVAQLSTSILSR